VKSGAQGKASDGSVYTEWVSVNSREAGFTYLTVLFAVAFMGLGLALAGEVWQTALARDREIELLYAGNQYRRAIERYYVSGPRQFPGTLRGPPEKTRASPAPNAT